MLGAERLIKVRDKPRNRVAELLAGQRSEPEHRHAQPRMFSRNVRQRGQRVDVGTPAREDLCAVGGGGSSVSAAGSQCSDRRCIVIENERRVGVLAGQLDGTWKVVSVKPDLEA